MAFASGTVNSYSELLSALRSACTANGWTLSGNVLSKGACYTSTGSSTTSLQVTGGTGASAGVLTGAGPRTAMARAPQSGLPIAFPATYFIHVLASPDEVYCILNWSTTCFAFVAFGCSPVPGLPGTGGWYTGTLVGDATVSNIVIGAGTGNNIQYNGFGCPAPFWASQSATTGADSGANSYVHHGLDAATWSAVTGTGPGGTTVIAAHSVLPMLSVSPNTWNGEASLLPIIATIARGSTKSSIVLQLKHARYLRNDNLSDGQVITLGPDKWKSYPFYRRSTANRNGGDNATTGTFGWAIRYDGT